MSRFKGITKETYDGVIVWKRKLCFIYAVFIASVWRPDNVNFPLDTTSHTEQRYVDILELTR